MHPAPSCPPVIGMTMLCGLLLFLTLAKQTEYSVKVFRLRRESTLFINAQFNRPSAKSLLDIPVKACVADKYTLRTTFFRHQYFSFLAFERSATSIFFCPQALCFVSKLPPTSKILAPPVDLAKTTRNDCMVPSSSHTSSSAVAKRPRDASCLSVVSFNSTKR